MENLNRGLLAQLPQSVTSSLVWTKKDKFSGHGWEGEAWECAAKRTPPRLDADEAIGLIREYGRPLPDRAILEGLTRLRALTSKPKDASTQDIELQLALYAVELRAKPGFAAAVVLQNAPETFKWWPSWQELSAMIDAEARPYNQLCRAVGL